LTLATTPATILTNITTTLTTTNGTAISKLQDEFNTIRSKVAYC
jgi:hypothetical protein